MGGSLDGDSCVEGAWDLGLGRLWVGTSGRFIKGGKKLGKGGQTGHRKEGDLRLERLMNGAYDLTSQ